ncbi:MAG: threonylcarbamoyl-AMP synthase [Holosporaceae bacterium]|nr:threonylcarbamoyl-AMP synthase [Holosporaceae bacterium]
MALRILAHTKENIGIAAEALKNGDLVAFPTETVYGLGGNAYSDEAIARIYAYKNRPKTKALSVCYAGLEKAYEDIEMDGRAHALAERLLPGPMTLVLRRRPETRLSALCTAGLSTVAIRVPSNLIALQLLAQLPFPLAVSSANMSGEPSPITAEQVLATLKDYADLIVLDGGVCRYGVESTIIDLTTQKILRQGAVSEQEINRVIHEL